MPAEKSSPSPSSSPKRFSHMTSLIRTFAKREEMYAPAPYDWKSMMEEPLKDGDLEGMKAAGLPAAQLNMNHLAHESESDAIKFQASQFLLSQAGHGPMTRVEHTIDYKRLPTDQLKAIVRSKLQSLQRRNPGFDASTLLMAPVQAESDPLSQPPNSDPNQPPIFALDPTQNSDDFPEEN